VTELTIRLESSCRDEKRITNANVVLKDMSYEMHEYQFTAEGQVQYTIMTVLNSITRSFFASIIASHPRNCTLSELVLF